MYDRISGRGAVRAERMRRAGQALVALSMCGVLWLAAFRHLLTGHSLLREFRASDEAAVVCQGAAVVVVNASDCAHAVETLLRYSELVARLGRHAVAGPDFLFVLGVPDYSAAAALRRLTRNCTVPLPHDYVPLNASAAAAVGEENDAAHCSSARCAACMRSWLPGDAAVPPLYAYAASPDAFAVSGIGAMRRPPAFWRAWLDALRSSSDEPGALCASCHTAARLWRYAFSGSFFE